LPHKKAFSSKTKTIRHVSLAWQAMKLHETFGLAKMEMDWQKWKGKMW
jgi:hypothetical protein